MENWPYIIISAESRAINGEGKKGEEVRTRCYFMIV